MIQIFIGFALLASAITANKFLLFYLSPFFLVGLRMLPAGIILLIITHHRSLKSRLPNLVAYALPLLCIALLTTFIPSWCKAYALQQLPSWKAAFIGSLDPFVTAIYSYLLWQERLTLKKIGGISLGFVGALIICFKPGLSVDLGQFVTVSLPELVAFAAVLTGRYGWIMAQKLLKKHRYSPAELNGIIMTASGLLALPVSWFTEQSWNLHAFAQTPVLFALAYTIIVGNVIAYTIYAYNLKNYSANFVSLAGFSIPFFVSLYGWALLGEQLTYAFVAAACVTLVGVYLFYSEELKTLTER